VGGYKGKGMSAECGEIAGEAAADDGEVEFMEGMEDVICIEGTSELTILS
jgi:hypothetical protein